MHGGGEHDSGIVCHLSAQCAHHKALLAIAVARLGGRMVVTTDDFSDGRWLNLDVRESDAGQVATVERRKSTVGYGKRE